MWLLRKRGRESFKTNENWEFSQRSLVPPEVEEAAGYSGVVLLLFLELAIPLQAALPTLVQVGCHVDAGAVLQEGLSRLLQLLHFAHVFQH